MAALKEENAKLTKRVADLEQALQSRMEGQDLIRTLREQDAEQIASLRSFIRTIHDLAADRLKNQPALNIDQK